MDRLKSFAPIRHRAGRPRRRHASPVVSDGVVWRAFFVAAAMLALLMAMTPAFG